MGDYEEAKREAFDLQFGGQLPPRSVRFHHGFDAGSEYRLKWVVKRLRQRAGSLAALDREIDRLGPYDERIAELHHMIDLLLGR